MQTVRTTIARPRGIAALAVRAAFVGACAVFVCACNTDNQVAGVPDVPTDYRLRHPITIGEADHTLEVFVGSNRGALNPTQRAEVAEFAHTWKREATGGVVVDLPVGTNNEHAAAEAMRAIRSILVASGVPANGVMVRGYHPPAINLATIRITYPRSPPRPGRAGSGPRISDRASTAIISKISRRGMRVARPSAILPPWSTIRPIWRNRAPKRRPMRCGARRLWSKYVQGLPTQTTYPAADTTKISNVNSTGQ